jgi:hypothetical protein
LSINRYGQIGAATGGQKGQKQRQTEGRTDWLECGWDLVLQTGGGGGRQGEPGAAGAAALAATTLVPIHEKKNCMDIKRDLPPSHIKQTVGIL